jgi:hypothetical protein
MTKLWLLLPLAFTAICCLMPALLLYFLGYQVNSDWNHSRIDTGCLVVKHNVYAKTEYDSGREAYLTKYNSYIVVEYTVENATLSSELYVTKGKDERKEYVWLNKHYPIGETTTCYRDRDDPTIVRLDLKETGIFLGFFIVFIILGAASLALGVYIFK